MEVNSTFSNSDTTINQGENQTGENLTSEMEVQRVVGEARLAFGLWAKFSYQERGKFLLKLRESIIQDMDRIAAFIQDENGKPLVEAISMEIYPVCDLISYFAKNTSKLLRPRRIGLGIWNLFGRSSRITFEPKGVVGIIAPWNFPFSIPMGEMVMALMAGNGVVLKPSEYSPVVGGMIQGLFKAVPFPEGLVGVIQGKGEVGAWLIDAPVDKIVFTGSVATGKKVMERAAKHLTPVTLELGGKDPMIVCHDADMEVVSSAAVWGAFSNAGQCCAGVERVIVDERVAEPFQKLVHEKTLKLRWGDAKTNFDVDVGPMTTSFQYEKVMAQLKEAHSTHASVLSSKMGRSQKHTLSIPPTVITDVDPKRAYMRDETFGPLMPIQSFATEEEAIRMANDSPYGLTASVWSRDIARARSMAQSLRAGTVMINECVYTHGLPQTPWGGIKDSGFGRTHSVWGLYELVNMKHVHTNRLSFIKSFWWYGYNEFLYQWMRGLTRTLTQRTFWGLLKALPNVIRLVLRKKL